MISTLGFVNRYRYIKNLTSKKKSILGTHEESEWLKVSELFDKVGGREIENGAGD